jgi:hypothetical protein
VVACRQLLVLPGQRAAGIPLLRRLSSEVLLRLWRQRLLQLVVLVVLLSLPEHWDL